MRFQQIGIKPEVVHIAVDEMRDGLAVRDRIGGADERQRRDDHFVAWFDASQVQGDLQRGRAVDNGYRVLGACDLGQAAFEFINVFADRRHPAGIDALFDVRPLIAAEFGFVQRDKRFGLAENLAQAGKQLLFKRIVFFGHGVLLRCCSGQLCMQPGWPGFGTIRRFLPGRA
ncbi:hypothetical protein D3C86_1283320 [compost metagenome]